MYKRRDVLKSLALGTLASAAPSISFAGAPADRRLVIVVLRGALDGLALCAPYGDGNYRKQRGELAIPAPGAADGLLKLDGLFGLHPSMQKTFERYQAGQASVIHAVASPYRERSHFDGQDLLENGGSRNGELRDGWLNRCLLGLNNDIGNEAAIALAQNTPLILRGENSVSSWAPSRLPDADSSTLARLQRLYAADEFFATRLEQALRSQDIARQSGDIDASGSRGNDARQFEDLMSAAARFLSTPDGPSIAVVEFGGWDTHANQGSSGGSLANRLLALDTGLDKLHRGLGKHWDKTAVAVVTEFGRTVRVNGTRGTDHGTASAALLLGGAVDGGRVIADWPGLGNSNLYADRDLHPTTDLRSLFKGLLVEHLDLEPSFVNLDVFPGSESAKPLRDLFLS